VVFVFLVVSTETSVLVANVSSIVLQERRIATDHARTWLQTVITVENVKMIVEMIRFVLLLIAFVTNPELTINVSLITIASTSTKMKIIVECAIIHVETTPIVLLVPVSVMMDLETVMETLHQTDASQTLIKTETTVERVVMNVEPTPIALLVPVSVTMDLKTVMETLHQTDVSQISIKNQKTVERVVMNVETTQIVRMENVFVLLLIVIVIIH